MAKPGYKKVIPVAPKAATRIFYRIESDGNILEKIGENSYKYLKSNTKEGETVTILKLPKGEYVKNVDEDQVK